MNTELETTATRVAMASQSLAPGEPLCTEAVDLALSRIAASADGDVGAIDALAALAFVEGNPMNLDQARKDFSSCNILLIPVCYKDHWVLYTYDDYDAKVRRYDSCWGKSAAADEGVYTLLSSLFERDMKKISGDVEHVSVSTFPFPLECWTVLTYYRCHTSQTTSTAVSASSSLPTLQAARDQSSPATSPSRRFTGSGGS